MITTCSSCGHEFDTELAPGMKGACPKCMADFLTGDTMVMKPEVKGKPGVDMGPLQTGDSFAGMEIIGFLGRGGMGYVYKARQVKLERTVALKILDPLLAASEEFGRRFNREAKALASLNHPSIVQVFEYGHEESLHYLIMEFIDGTTLRHILTGQRIEPATALRYVPQICDALDYAHSRGVIHRDIKPENILIDKQGALKIADFGLAKMQEGNGVEASQLTMTGNVMGTMSYMAPEQLKQFASVDHRADIYALGVVFYEMLTGELPVGRFPTPSESARVDAKLDDVVLKALATDPDNRYQEASQVKTDLGDTTSHTSAASAPGAASRRKLSKLALWGALGIPMAIVAAILVGIIGLISNRTPILTIIIAALLMACIVVIVGVALSIAGLVAIRKSNGHLGGEGTAKFGICLPVGLILVVLAIFFLRIYRVDANRMSMRRHAQPQQAIPENSGKQTLEIRPHMKPWLQLVTVAEGLRASPHSGLSKIELIVDTSDDTLFGAIMSGPGNAKINPTDKNGRQLAHARLLGFIKRCRMISTSQSVTTGSGTTLVTHSGGGSADAVLVVADCEHEFAIPLVDVPDIGWRLGDCDFVRAALLMLRGHGVKAEHKPWHALVDLVKTRGDSRPERPAFMAILAPDAVSALVDETPAKNINPMTDSGLQLPQSEVLAYVKRCEVVGVTRFPAARDGSSKKRVTITVYDSKYAFEMPLIEVDGKGWRLGSCDLTRAIVNELLGDELPNEISFDLAKITEKQLFPISGLILGQSTKDQLDALGPRHVRYNYYVIDGFEFWYDDDSKRFSGMHMVKGRALPQRWREFGFDWRLSYRQWLELLAHQGFKISIAEPPEVVEYNGHNSFTAKVKASRRTPHPLSVILEFKYSKGRSGSTRDTLYSISVR